MNERQKTMRGVQLIGHGGPEMLSLRHDIPVPSIGPQEVLIRVSAAGINNTDINTRTGWYSKNDGASADAGWAGTALQLPRIQGADVCGHIVAVGREINKYRIGERILVEPCIWEVNGNELSQPWYFGSECDGGFAEYTRITAKHAHKIDSLLSDIELASFPCSYSTAENMLTRANVTQNDHVLITGASGGVGSAAIQLAKARGAYVIAITSPGKSKQLLELGADKTIFRDCNLPQELGTSDIDVVIDLVAGKQWPHYLEVLRPKGRYAVSGAIAGPIVELDVRTLYLKDLSLFGCTSLEPGVFHRLIKLIEAGAISPVIAQSFPLEEIGLAQQLFLEKSHIGKMVLTL